jgi:hypothetical protein
LPGRKKTSARGVSHTQSFTLFLFFFILFLLASFYQKYKKISSYFNLLFMSSLVAVTMSPEEMTSPSNKRVRIVSKKLGLEFMIGMEKLNRK